MVPLSMTCSDLWPGFQGHDIFWNRISGKRRVLKTINVLVLVLKLRSWSRSRSWKVLLTSPQYGIIVSVRRSLWNMSLSTVGDQAFPVAGSRVGEMLGHSMLLLLLHFMFVAIVWTFISTCEMLHPTFNIHVLSDAATSDILNAVYYFSAYRTTVYPAVISL